MLKPSISKNRQGSNSTSATTELNLEISNEESKTVLSQKSKLLQKRKEKKHANADIFSNCNNSEHRRERESEQIVSIQNLQFPETNHKKGETIKVKHKKCLLIPSKSKSTPSKKDRGYDFTSSTNSHVGEWVLPVPNKLHSKCSSISTEENPKSETIKTDNDNQNSFKKVDTSQDVLDSKNKMSKKLINFQNSKCRKSCNESFEAKGPKTFIGHCPPNYEQLSKMSKSKQKFFLTQDPRKTHCLVKPEMIRSTADSMNNELYSLTNMVKNAQNVCAGSNSELSEDFICEVIDLENPLQLDFQGLDYTNTYQKDEQDLQNQQNYRRVCRYMERRRVKAETQANVEEELHKELLNIPKRFEIPDRSKPIVFTPPEEPIKLGKLLRSPDKPLNKKIIQMEEKQRKERYKNLYLRKKARKEHNLEETENRKKIEMNNLPLTLAKENFQNLKKNIDDAIDKCTKTETILETPTDERHKFPHTMRETKLYKRDLKQRNRRARDEATIKKDFFKERLGKEKQFAAAELEISSDTPRHSSEASKITEQSTNDEDDMIVGKQGSKFKLRGFHFKLGSNLRGKFHQHEKQQSNRKEKSCLTRDQWLKELAPQKEKIQLDVEMGIQKIQSPNNSKLVLYPPPLDYKPPKAKRSAIREFRLKPLGQHYERILRKNLKFAKPRLRYSVKKFNLISYRYGDPVKRFSQIKDHTETPTLQIKTTHEYMEAKAHLEKRRQEEIKQKRLQLLGIPCGIIKKSCLQTRCENSSSDTDSKWVPDRESFVEQKESSCKTQKEKIPFNKRCNMPAPKFREPTLRQHPRHPRDYKKQRVPSEIFNQEVLTTAVPYMYKLPPDLTNFSNVALKKTPYTDLFEARHHHDHWNPTQLKQVDVHYQAQLIKPEITKVNDKSKQVIMENFHMANPPCNQFVEMNLTMPKWDVNEMIRDHLKTTKEITEDTKTMKTKNLCSKKKFVFQSRDPKEFEDYPGRQEYLQLLKNVKDTMMESKHTEQPENKLYVNKSSLLKELEEEIQSIESCLTSLSSSECTNLSNDSGSYLLMEGQEKIPLDFIRKSLVPFEELQRSRFYFKPIDVDKEASNPYQVLPFAGQKKAQLELTIPKDSFFTFNTRLKNGLRLRLEVPVQDVREKLIGRGGSNKHKGLVSTDIDENYIDELKNRPPVRMCNFKSDSAFIKDALRLKFESMIIQGQLIRTKIYDRLNDQHWTDMQRVKNLFEKLFAKWEKHEYDAAMNVVYKVQKFYDESDRLKNEFNTLERQQVILNMDIVFLEGYWIHCIMLQNFHYLLGDEEWREEHDWIHRLPIAEGEDNVLENFADSIAKRSKINIRAREKDDAWAIKSYYENVYLQNKRPILIVFPNAESFLKGLDNLKSKTFISLLEMHLTLAIHMELQNQLETFIEFYATDLKDKQEYVSRKYAKLHFLSDRANWLSKRCLHFLNEPIDTAFNNDLFNRDRAVIAEAWRRIVPDNIRGSSEEELYPIDMVAMMSDVVMELIAKFESIPMDISLINETKLRKRRNYLRKQSHQAYHIERRIEVEMKKVVKNLEPPYQKFKSSTKLPRYFIRKRKKTVIKEEKKISERAKLFLRAFNEEEDDIQISDIHDSIAQVDNIQEQIVPFYFDHFLKLNAYTPNYNFKTQVEMRDGPEIERLQVKSVIPEIQERLEKWEKIKRKVMEDNIAQNPKMYVHAKKKSV